MKAPRYSQLALTSNYCFHRGDAETPTSETQLRNSRVWAGREFAVLGLK